MPRESLSKDAIHHRATHHVVPAWVSSRSWAGGVLDLGLRLYVVNDADVGIKHLKAYVTCDERMAQALCEALGFGVATDGGWVVPPSEVVQFNTVLPYLRNPRAVTFASIACRWGVTWTLSTSTATRTFHAKAVLRERITLSWMYAQCIASTKERRSRG